MVLSGPKPHVLSNRFESSKVGSDEVFDLIGEGIFTVSASGAIHANRAFLELLGFSRRKVTLKQLLGKIAEAPDVKARDQLKALLENGRSGEVTLALPTKENASRRVAVTIVSGEKDVDDYALAGILKTLPDESQVDSNEANWLLNAIFEGIEDGILILNPDGMVIRRANLAASRIFGYSVAELNGRSMVDLLATPDRGSDIAATIQSKIPFLRSIHLDLEMRRSNGTSFPALHGINAITANSGAIVAWMWIISDMTQRVFLNRALFDLETRYRILFDRTADPTLIIDAGSKKIIDANSAAEQQLGYRRPELIGLTMDDITPAARRGDMERDYGALKVGETSTIEGSNLTKSGEQISVQISVVATDFEGRKVLIASCRDVSQQRQQQLEKLRLEKLDAVRKVAGALAHEFSQPLQGLVTIVELLARPEISPEEKEGLLLKIAPSVERMTMLLDQMKRIVRLETKPYTGSDDIVDFQHSSKAVAEPHNRCEYPESNSAEACQ